MKKEIRYGLSVISLIVFATASSGAQNKNESLPTLHGEAAIEKLQGDGQYENLLLAAKALRDETGPTASLFGQSAKIFAADGGSFQNFGFSVAVSGNTAIIGSYQAPAGGAAYVFVRNNTVWTLQQKLTASDAGQFDQLGFGVGIDGDTVVVGAAQDDVGSNKQQGSAYVFVRNGTTWTEQQKLIASDGDGNDFFGENVSIEGDTVIVGAHGGSTPADEHRGAAYVFVRSGTTWAQQQKLTASDGEFTDGFGFSVSISGDTAIVGSWHDNVGANNTQGSAYIFVRSGTTWTQQQKLTASDGTSSEAFGISAAIDGDTAIVGAFFGKVGQLRPGTAYVFVRSGTVWTEQQKLISSDGLTGDEFGRSVAILGNTAVVGAGDDNGGSNVGRGSAYIFTRTGTTWTEQQHLFASDETAGAHFGISVDISANTILVGAVRADVAAANSFVPEAIDQGAVYVFVPQAFVGGRVLRADGFSGVPKADVQVMLANGTTLVTRTSPFGYYRFDGLDAGQTVTISVTVKQFQFASQLVMVNDNLSSVDFIALP